MYNVKINDSPKPFEITKWLCISSCFFLVPGTYAFYNQLYLYGIVCTYTSILSVNHWGEMQKMELAD